MTTQTTRLPRESLPLATASEVPSLWALNIASGPVSTTDRVPAKIIHVTLRDSPAPLPQGFIGIHQHIAEAEADLEKKARLGKARAKLAEQLFDGDPPTIRTLRLHKGMSQTSLAQAIHTSQSHIARIEAGRHDPTFNTFDKIAHALGVPVVEIVGAFENARNVDKSQAMC